MPIYGTMKSDRRQINGSKSMVMVGYGLCLKSGVTFYTPCIQNGKCVRGCFERTTLWAKILNFKNLVVWQIHDGANGIPRRITYWPKLSTWKITPTLELVDKGMTSNSAESKFNLLSFHSNNCNNKFHRLRSLHF